VLSVPLLYGLLQLVYHLAMLGVGLGGLSGEEALDLLEDLPLGLSLVPYVEHVLVLGALVPVGLGRVTAQALGQLEGLAAVGALEGPLVPSPCFIFPGRVFFSWLEQTRFFSLCIQPLYLLTGEILVALLGLVTLGDCDMCKRRLLDFQGSSRELL